MSSQRADAEGRLVAIDAAAMGGLPDRAADVAADLETCQASRESCCGDAGRPARCTIEIPGIVRSPVNGIERLMIGNETWNVGLTHQDRARREQAFDRNGIALGDIVGEFKRAPGAGHAGNIESFLDRDRDAVQRTDACALGKCFIAGTRGFESAIPVHIDHGVERGIISFDASAVEPKHFNGRNGSLFYLRSKVQNGGKWRKCRHQVFPTRCRFYCRLTTRLTIVK